MSHDHTTTFSPPSVHGGEQTNLPPVAPVSSEHQLERLWTPGYLRLFISHKAEHKAQAGQLKDELRRYGVTCFVAHEDIEPTREWENEIRKALASMEVLIALMTDGIFTSVWVNQEIGWAIGRDVPIIPVRMSSDPQGFIARLQAVTCKDTSEDSARMVYDALWRYQGLESRLQEALVAGLENAHFYPDAIKVSKELVKRLTTACPSMIERIRNAMMSNHYVSRAYFVPERLQSLIQKLESGEP